jgi:hypothetical protein
VDGGTGPLPPVPVGARVLVYDRHGDTLPAEVTDRAGDRLTYRCADGLEHRGQLDDVAEVLPAVAVKAAPATDQATRRHRQGARL